MSLIETIRAAYLAARKSRASTVGALSALVGETETAQKAKGRDPSAPLDDSETRAIVQRFYKGNTEALDALIDRNDPKSVAARRTLVEERLLYEEFLPRQMDEAAIEAFARTQVAAGQNSLGGIMGALKTAHSGAYEGKQASMVIRRVLAP